MLWLVYAYHANVSTGSAGQNKQHLMTKNTAKLDRETEELQHQRVSLEVGKVIQQGRQNKGLTQKDLATVSNATANPYDSLRYWCISVASSSPLHSSKHSVGENYVQFFHISTYEHGRTL